MVGIDRKAVDPDPVAGIDRPFRQWPMKEGDEGLGQPLREWAQTIAETGAKDECVLHGEGLPSR